jgi:hypothetical protein
MNESSVARRMRVYVAQAALAGGSAGVAVGCAAPGDEQDEASGARAQDLGGTIRQKKHAGKMQWAPINIDVGFSQPSQKAMNVSFECAGTKAPHSLVRTTEKGAVVVASLAGCTGGELVTLYKVNVVDGGLLPDRLDRRRGRGDV